MRATHQQGLDALLSKAAGQIHQVTTGRQRQQFIARRFVDRLNHFVTAGRGRADNFVEFLLGPLCTGRTDNARKEATGSSFRRPEARRGELRRGLAPETTSGTTHSTGIALRDRSEMISARMATAISGGVLAPISNPAGVCTCATCSSGSLQSSEHGLSPLSTRHQSDIRHSGAQRRGQHRRFVSAVRGDHHGGCRLELSRRGGLVDDVHLHVHCAADPDECLGDRAGRQHQHQRGGSRNRVHEDLHDLASTRHRQSHRRSGGEGHHPERLGRRLRARGRAPAPESPRPRCCRRAPESSPPVLIRRHSARRLRPMSPSVR